MKQTPPRKHSQNLRRQWLILGFWLTLISALFSLTRAPDALDRIFDDLALTSFERPVDSRLLIVAIDDNSLQQIGQWPWPRGLHAQLIEKLEQAGAKAVALDIVMTEPGSQPEQDLALANTLKAAPIPVFLPVIEPDRKDLSTEKNGMITPASSLHTSQANWVDIAVNIDNDGMVRSLPFQSNYPTPLSLAMAKTFQPNLKVKLNHAFRIPWVGPPGSVAQVSYVDVLKGHVPAELLKGRLVYVGATALGLQDTFVTPEGRIMPGVEIHAQTTDALLHHIQYTHAAPAWSWLLSVFSVLFLIAMMGNASSSQLALGVISTMALVLGIVALLVVHFHVFVAPTLTLFALLMVYPLWSWQRLEWVSRFASEQLQTLYPKLALGSLFKWPALPMKRTQDVLSAKLETVRALNELVNESEAFFRGILDEHPHPVMIVNTRGELVRLNGLATQLFALSQGTVIDNFLGRARWTQLCNNSSPEEIELTIQTGEVRVFEAQTFSLNTRENDFTLLLLIDRTEEKRMQQQREDMVRFLSHDLRAPQARILAMIQDHEAHGNQEYSANAELLQGIAQSAQKTINLAQAFLDSQRADHQHFDLNEVQVNNIALEVIYQMQAIAHAKKITLALEEGDALYYCLAEHQLLSRMLENLISNAIHYSPEGGKIDLILKTGDGLEQTSFCIEVHDQGPGVPVEDRELIFTKFGQASNHQGTQGTGLGLHFVALMTQKLKGTITCSESPSGGACFTIELPAEAIEAL